MFIVFNFMATLGFILIQDPYDYHTQVPKKNNLEKHMYISKLNHIKKNKPSKLIMGDSIVADGINPQSYFGPNSYNAAIYGIDITETEKYFNEITNIYTPENILFSVNYGQLNVNRASKYTYDHFNEYDGETKKSTIYLLYLFLKNHLDLHALRSSFSILFGKTNDFDSYGFNNLKNKDFGKIPSDRTDQCNASIIQLEKDLMNFSTYSSSEDSIESIKKIIEYSYLNDINLDIIFPPLNILAYKKIDELNLGDNFIRIKQSIDSANSDLAKVYDKKPHKILDLANINEITSNQCSQSIYYPDAMHIAPIVGNMIKTKFKNLKN